MSKEFKKFKPLSNKSRIDTDQDGLTDYEEINIYGTNPYDPDSDKDGVSDGEEVNMRRNPLGHGSLRDLFIPYIGNQYQPKILSPYRLLFYSISALAIKLIVIGLIILIPTVAWLTPDVLTAEGKKIVQLTNNIRQDLSVPLLKESTLLNQAAFNKAQDMLIQQYFAHVGPDQNDLSDWISGVGYQYDIAGENLAMGFSNATEVVTAWTKSPTHYANLIDPDFKEIGVGMVAGLYQGNDTTLVAQYFTYPRGGVVNTASVSTPKPAPVPVEKPTPVIELKPAEVPVQEIIEILGQTDETPSTPEPEPKSEPESIPAPAPVLDPVPDLPVIPKPEIVLEPVLEQITEPELIPEVVANTLEAPNLIYPQSDVVLGSNQITLVVYAPKASLVEVYNNDALVTSRNDLNSDFFDFNITLVPGENVLTFKSVAEEGQGSVSKNYIFNIDTKPPVINSDKTTIALIETEGEKEKIIKAVAYLSPDTRSAEVLFNDYRLELNQTEKLDDGMVQWTGQLIIFDQDKNKIFGTITLPVVVARDEFNNEARVDISWDKVIPLKPSIVKQYLFAKTHPLQYVDLLFDFTQWYYILILAIAIIALILNIFIEIKKQYPQIIISSLGFIGLLVILIIV